MSTGLIQSNFDTAIFQKNVYKLVIDDVKAIKEELDKINTTGPYFVFTFVNLEHRVLRELEKTNFRLISIRSRYRRELSSAREGSRLPSGYTIHYSSKNELEIKESDLLPFREVIGETSRYYKDVLLPRKQVQLMYQNWLHNSFFDHYVDDCLMITYRKELVAILTLKFESNLAKIDLIGVLPHHQRKGLGNVLIKNAVKLSEEKASSIEVVTEGENIQAARLYQKNGFIIDDMKLAYHLITK